MITLGSPQRLLVLFSARLYPHPHQIQVSSSTQDKDKTKPSQATTHFYDCLRVRGKESVLGELRGAH